ncbi:MAG: hypothetical protein ACJA2Q_001376 [Pseudohongiellaceae bacterium]|jgi:hypothetical protein
MRKHLATFAIVAISAVGLWGLLPAGLAQAQINHPQSKLKSLTKSSSWELVKSTPLQFPSHHPQGLVKVGDHFFMSSVETTEAPKRLSDPLARFERTPGAGTGHLFKFAQDGSLLHDLILGEGTMYHPGGIDFDGEFIWVSVAEYRPDSQSIVYKINPETMAAIEVFRFSDHLGGILKDLESGTLYGISWGSRKFYQWPININEDENMDTQQQEYIADSAVMQPNRLHYIDYQDCQWLAPHNILCSGVNTYSNDGLDRVKLGGIELLELPGFRVTMQLPVTKMTDTGVVLTQNPFYYETNTAQENFMHFVPEDDSSTLFSYRVIP